eukprot:3359960-Pyramimonas_sp.AAC.1
MRSAQSGKRLPASFDRPEAVTSLARLSFPQACAAVSSLIRAAGISSRVSGEAIYLYAAFDVPLSTWHKPIPTRTWHRKVGVAGMSESDRLYNDVEHMISSDSTISLVNNTGAAALEAALLQELQK